MAEATFHFPRGFLWGTATAAHQVEGNNKNNNWWSWEQDDGRIARGHKSGLACDWWGGRWREDFDRAVESHQSIHRLSIEWSRIQPGPERWDENALDYYRQIVRGLRERGLTPMVTLHHFTDPLWITENGGWEKDISTQFSAYVEKVVDALKEFVTLWCTFNEPNVYATLGYVNGLFPPGKTNILQAFQVMANMVSGHAAAYHTIHRMQPKAQVGLAHQYRGIKPLHSWFPLDKLVAGFQFKSFNDFFPTAARTGILKLPIGRIRIPAAKNTQDYFGLNYYTQDYVAFHPLALNDAFGKRSFHPDAELSETGFMANTPGEFYRSLHWAKGFGLPIFVTENGVEDSTDQLRPRYIAEHIHQMWRAVNQNWPIKGYFHWTLVDNFEWERGWVQRFGLWELDTETQARRKRPSADFYASICKENALSSELVATYAPDIFLKMFPNP